MDVLTSICPYVIFFFNIGGMLSYHIKHRATFIVLLDLTRLLILLRQIIEILINNWYLKQITYLVDKLINIIIKQINSYHIHIRWIDTNMTYLLNV